MDNHIVTFLTYSFCYLFVWDKQGSEHCNVAVSCVVDSDFRKAGSFATDLHSIYKKAA